MKKLVALSVLSATMLSSMTAHAATAELKLIGTITPAACVPNFTGGATINYGNIPASSLNQSAQTNLPNKTTVLTVACDAPIKFALKAVDERAATLIPEINLPAAPNPVYMFGLGAASNGAKIGAYGVQMSNVTTDAGTTRTMRSLDGGANWYFNGGAFGSDGRLIAFSDVSGSMLPAAHSSLTADITIVAAVDRASNLPLTSEIAIDGLTTIEVVYL